MDFDDLATFGNDDLPVPGPASSVSSADTEKSTQEVTRSVSSATTIATATQSPPPAFYFPFNDLKPY